MVEDWVHAGGSVWVAAEGMGTGSVRGLESRGGAWWLGDWEVQWEGGRGARKEAWWGGWQWVANTGSGSGGMSVNAALMTSMGVNAMVAARRKEMCCETAGC